MERILIKDKLQRIECSFDQISLGDFDYIGEFTAKKARSKDDPLFRSVGAFFRPNYERGILAYALIKRFEIRSVFEIGFGRGYFAFCAAKAMCDMGFDDGQVVSVDPNIDEKHVQNLAQVFPREWFSKLNVMKGTSADAFTQLGDRKFDLVYIDGDHRAEAVKLDWLGVKDRFNKFVIFDDYRQVDDKKDIEVRSVVDAIDSSKELVVTDRRIFMDDRNYTDEQINYGQVIIKNPNFDQSTFLSEW